MQKILRKAAASLSSTSKIDKDQMHNYFMSGKTENRLHSEKKLIKTPYSHPKIIILLFK